MRERESVRLSFADTVVDRPSKRRTQAMFLGIGRQVELRLEAFGAESEGELFAAEDLAFDAFGDFAGPMSRGAGAFLQIGGLALESSKPLSDGPGG